MEHRPVVHNPTTEASDSSDSEMYSTQDIEERRVELYQRGFRAGERLA